MNGELIAPTLNLCSSATQHSSVPSPDASWIGLLPSLRALKIAYSVILLSSLALVSKKGWWSERSKRSEGQWKKEKRKENDVQIFPRRPQAPKLPSTRQGDYIYRKSFTSFLLSLQGCGSLCYTIFTANLVRRTSFQQPHYIRRRSHVSFCKTWTKS